jgi:hypothetical protein
VGESLLFPFSHLGAAADPLVLFVARRISFTVSGGPYGLCDGSLEHSGLFLFFGGDFFWVFYGSL